MNPLAANSARQCCTDTLSIWRGICLAIVAPWDAVLRSFSERNALLPMRMAALGLDPSTFPRAKPTIFFDLQRRCTACGCYERCEWDLRQDPAIPDWQDYCPNAPVLLRLAGKYGPVISTKRALSQSAPQSEQGMHLR